ncbi:MAG: peptidase U32 family protein [Collinsella sp.]
MSRRALIAERRAAPPMSWRVRRVATARELTVDEIAALCAAGVPISNCHGGLSAIPGRASSLGLRRGRSAMRGDARRAGRVWRTDLVDERDKTLLAVSREMDLLCPHDYLGIAHLPELVDAGVASLKIEGRMKNPDYVFNVVRVWRRALDMLRDGAWDPGTVEELERELGRSFNRGFTGAYLRGRSGAELMSFERAIGRAMRVGRLVAVGDTKRPLKLDAARGGVVALEITVLSGVDAFDVPKRWPQVPAVVSGGGSVVVHASQRWTRAARVATDSQRAGGCWWSRRRRC